MHPHSTGLDEAVSVLPRSNAAGSSWTPGTQRNGSRPTDRLVVTGPFPPVVARHDVPEEWRFVLVLPDAKPGRSGDDEDASMRSAVERADPTIADDIASILVRRTLPAIAEDDPERFGCSVAEIGRRNGAWYADEQGGVYRPPVGELVTEMETSPAVFGAGQSSWGPAVYGVTTRDLTDEAVDAAHTALDSAGVDGDVSVTSPRNRGVE